MSNSSSAVPDALFQDAVRVLDTGGVIAYPTETVWGLAARPQAAAELYFRKGRMMDKPLQLSCADAEKALALAQPSEALRVLSGCWPGPLTVITPIRPEYLFGWGEGAQAVAPGGWVGLRVPAHPVAQALLRWAGPLATTSLNPSGRPAATTWQEAQAYGLADLTLPTDESENQSKESLPSTVLRLPGPQDAPRAQVVRVGGISVADLRDLLAPLGLEVTDSSAGAPG